MERFTTYVYICVRYKLKHNLQYNLLPRLWAAVKTNNTINTWKHLIIINWKVWQVVQNLVPVPVGGNKSQWYAVCSIRHWLNQYGARSFDLSIPPTDIYWYQLATLCPTHWRILRRHAATALNEMNVHVVNPSTHAVCSAKESVWPVSGPPWLLNAVPTQF